MKSREVLAEHFRDLGFKVGVEVGVATGKFTRIMFDLNPGVKIYGIDTWQVYREYPDYRRQRTLDGAYALAMAALAPELESGQCIFIKKQSMDAVKDFLDESVDFVFIDGNHSYEYTRDDIREWTKKVRKGGIVSGHDYVEVHNVGVIQAVQEYIKQHPEYKLKLTKETGRNRPTWYFIK
jgi:hypothetical protein